ncbi:hypothetical protein [Caulobacter sp. 17J80-11]|uniref:hypothetical protein n=1 Tax=Caulobacter sp. 17J80-11 TaxID=2763502 RepID=UPI001653D88A|nr:hypothetical protein [Caulobacter sp. 17J80-11]MBC6981383.1 hypothetical protein [Caulobacter sp. 17J80-11]
MKLYYVGPRIPDGADEATVTARERACIGPIAELVGACIENDPALFGVWHVNEIGKPRAEQPDMVFGNAQVVRLQGAQVIRDVLRRCVDPSSGEFMLIRSLVTCRAVMCGYDGQAFLCLPEDDPTPVSPNVDLILVEDRSDLIVGTDYMDGLLLD